MNSNDIPNTPPRTPRGSGPSLSYEFFPPKSPIGWAHLYATLGEVALELNLDFVSVTCGAGGKGDNELERSIELASRVRKELNIISMTHMTCISMTEDEVLAAVTELRDSNVRAIMALRGDLPQDENFKFPENGFRHASELISCVRRKFADVQIGCACYPEKHVESPSLEEDIKWLKHKQDCGADFAITQLFYDNQNFFSFLEKTKLNRAQQLSACKVPDELRGILSENGENAKDEAIAFSIRQCRELLKNGAPGIHFYTLNKGEEVRQIIDALIEEGFFESKKK